MIDNPTVRLFFRNTKSLLVEDDTIEDIIQVAERLEEAVAFVQFGDAIVLRSEIIGAVMA